MNRSSLIARISSGAAMKVQYFGNVNDYGKFVLLRLLSEVGKFEIGVCWMLTKADSSGNYGNRSYLRQPDRWRSYAPSVFDALATVPPKPTIEDLRRVEDEALIPRATFFNEDMLEGLAKREAYQQACMKAFEARDLTFFDPDQGLELKSTAKGDNGSDKYAYLDEIAEHYQAGRSILLYQHFQHVSREPFIRDTAHRLRSTLAGSTIWSFKAPHVVFLLAARADHVARAKKVTASLHQGGCVPRLFKSAQAILGNHR
jgi:hypothetical protein